MNEFTIETKKDIILFAIQYNSNRMFKYRRIYAIDRINKLKINFMDMVEKDCKKTFEGKYKVLPILISTSEMLHNNINYVMIKSMRDTGNVFEKIEIQFGSKK